MKDFAKVNNLTNYGQTAPGDIPEIHELLNGEVSQLISPKNHFAPFERIYKFTVMKTPFEVNRELSAKMELLRPTVYSMYTAEIEALTK